MDKTQQLITELRAQANQHPPDADLSMFDVAATEQQARIAALQAELNALRTSLVVPMSRLFGVHPDDLSDNLLANADTTTDYGDGFNAGLVQGRKEGWEARARDTQMVWSAGGEANFYTLSFGTGWFALLQINGELTVEQQEAWLRRVFGGPECEEGTRDAD